MNKVIPEGESLHQEGKVLRPRFGYSCEKEQILDQFPVRRGIDMRLEIMMRPRLQTFQSGGNTIKELEVAQGRDHTGWFHFITVPAAVRRSHPPFSRCLEKTTESVRQSG